MGQMRGPRTRRGYQDKGVRDIFQSWMRLFLHVLYVLPTGAGKTIVAVRVIERLLRSGKRILILVHRREILRQTLDRLERAGLNASDVGIVWLKGVIVRSERGTAFRSNPDAPIQLASVDTLVRRKAPPPPADVVVIDEAHHAPSPKFSKVLSWYTNLPWLGLTATPTRLDGKPLKPFFDHMVQGPDYAKLIKLGYLEPPECWSWEHGVDLRRVRRRKDTGDYDPKTVSKRMRRKVLLANPVKMYKKHGRSRAAACFTCDVPHAMRQAQEFNAAGVRAEVLTGKTPDRVRREMIGPGGRLERGATKVVVTCGVLSEGWDMPAAKVLILCRPTASLVVHLQQCGRGARPYKAKRGPWKDNWVPLTILDHAKNLTTKGLGLPHDPRTWSLDGGLVESEGARTTPQRVCESCGFMQPSGKTVCNKCGHAFEAKRSPEEVAGDLRTINADDYRLNYERTIRARLQSVAGLSGEVLSHAVASAVATHLDTHA